MKVFKNTRIRLYVKIKILSLLLVTFISFTFINAAILFWKLYIFLRFFNEISLFLLHIKIQLLITYILNFLWNVLKKWKFSIQVFARNLPGWRHPVWLDHVPGRSWVCSLPGPGASRCRAQQLQGPPSRKHPSHKACKMEDTFSTAEYYVT